MGIPYIITREGRSSVRLEDAEFKALVAAAASRIEHTGYERPVTPHLVRRVIQKLEKSRIGRD